MLWVLASCYSESVEGIMDSELVGTHEFDAVTAAALGRDIKKAMKKYSVIENSQDQPRDPIQVLSKGKVSKFIKGSISVSVSLYKDSKEIEIQGGSAPTSAGAIYSKPLKRLPEKVSETELGEVVLKLIKSIKKKDGL